MATNLFELGVRPEAAALILRNSPEVVRVRYIKLEKAGKKVDAMARLEQAYDACRSNCAVELFRNPRKMPPNRFSVI